MKKFVSLLLLGLFVLTVFAQKNHIPTFIENEKQSFQKKLAFKAHSHHANYDLIYHRVYWNIDPAAQFISGSVTTHFKTLESNFNTVTFDLYSLLIVDSVWYHNQKVTFQHASDLLIIELSQTIALNTLDSLTVFYHGVPPSGSGFGAFETSNHDGVPVMWTLSEPYGAKEWWPCKETLTDKIDSIDIYVETLNTYKVASNGKLISENSSGNNIITHWSHRYPITTYLVAIAVTNYESFSDFAQVDENNTVEILNYVYPEDKDFIMSSAGYTVGVMELFSNLFIPYPFYTEKYGHAQFGWGGGMEHQTMSFMGGFSPSLITHELAHQWFGDHVTCGSWQDIWVNEGFAVFCESLAQEFLHPSNFLQWKKDRIKLVLNNARSGSVFVEDTTDINRIFNYYLTYQKGGLIIHQLRNQIGDEAFFTGTKNLLTNNQTSGGFASAGKVKEFFEEAADSNLTSYFDDWYFGEGYPVYSFEWQQDLNFNLSLKIMQSTTHNSVLFYAMQVPMLLEGDGIQKMVTFHNTENNQTFTCNPGFAVNQIVFDPEYTIIAPHPANIVLSIEENNTDNTVSITPNPSNDKLYIKTSHNNKIKQISIIDNTGRNVYTENLNSLTKKTQVDISSFAQGFYYVRVESSHGFIIKQIVKSH